MPTSNRGLVLAAKKGVSWAAAARKCFQITLFPIGKCSRFEGRFFLEIWTPERIQKKR